MRTTSAARTGLALALLALAPTPAAGQAKNDGLSPQDEKMLALAQTFAARCEAAMETWVDNGEVSKEKLFAALYFPVPGTNPPKFTTDWDKLADRDIRDISDDILSKSAAIVFAVLVDRNGYLPAHNRKYSLPLTGNPAVDLVGNRTKRIFTDRTGFAAARNEKPYLLQRYSRDTGELMRDISVPVRVGGRRWGAVRIGYQALDEG